MLDYLSMNEMPDISELDANVLGNETLGAIPGIYDTDGDGAVDTLAFDLNGDSASDVHLIDTDGDMQIDTQVDIYSGYSQKTVIETVFDPETGTAINQTGYFDIDGNTSADLITNVTFDEHGDISSYTETNYYGDSETAGFERTYIDSGAENGFDIVIDKVDTDGTGLYDTIETTFEGTGEDGFRILEEFYDSDPTDGVDEYDTYRISIDYGMDRSYEVIGEYDIKVVDGMVIPVLDDEIYYDNSFVSLDCFDTSTDSEFVIGDPTTSMQFWEYQGNTGRCALYSQKFIIEELTGQNIDIEAFAADATENGWFDEDDGTYPLDMNKMLDLYGVENEMSFNNSYDDLRNSLSEGDKVIVSLDADEIWFGEQDDIFTPGDGANHAVQVIGIDESNPDNPMVILNDSGNDEASGGRGELVPRDVFIDAWEDGNFQMIVCPA